MAPFKSKFCLKHWRELQPWRCHHRSITRPTHQALAASGFGGLRPPLWGAGVMQPGAAVLVMAHVSEVSQESSNFLSSSVNRLCRCSLWLLADITHAGDRNMGGEAAGKTPVMGLGCPWGVAQQCARP